MYTEDEAKQRWCPFARLAFEAGTFNRAVIFDAAQGDPKKDAVCLASACMAWRWKMEYREGNEYAIRPGETGWVEGTDAEQRAGLDWKRNTGLGYCGLAGNP